MTAIAPPMTPWLGGLVAGASVAAIVAVVFIALRRGKLGAGRSRQELVEARESLLDHIAGLDDLHSAGELPDEEWMRERSASKAQLMAVVAQLERDGKRA